MSYNKIKKIFILFFGLLLSSHIILAMKIQRKSLHGQYPQTISISKVQPKVLIWDLGGTLVETNKFGIANKVGTGEFIKYFFQGHNPGKIKDHIFRTLDNMSLKKKTNLYPAKSEDRILPDLMCQWLEGKKAGSQISQEADIWIQKASANGFYSSKQQAKLVNKSIKIMFDPEILAANMQPIRQTLCILEECKKQVNKFGKSIHKLLILSNLDPQTYAHFMETPHGKEVLKYFESENIIISGNIGMIKPHPNIYNYVIKKYKLNPKDCILIDDQQENIDGARNAGMQAILFKDKNFNNLRYDLLSLNVI